MAPPCLYNYVRMRMGMKIKRQNTLCLIIHSPSKSVPHLRHS